MVWYVRCVCRAGRRTYVHTYTYIRPGWVKERVTTAGRGENIFAPLLIIHGGVCSVVCCVCVCVCSVGVWDTEIGWLTGVYVMSHTTHNTRPSLLANLEFAVCCVVSISRGGGGRGGLPACPPALLTYLTLHALFALLTYRRKKDRTLAPCKQAPIRR